jgi:hypothetical protein
MAAKTTTLEKLRRLLHAKKVTTLGAMARRMQCSPRTVQRRLDQLNAITSYNKNGRYYVLPDVPAFDVHGLWHDGDIGFSRYGNLTETVTQLVRNSDGGLTSAELGRLLRVEARSFLSRFRDRPALKREVHHGRLVYFAAESPVYRRQISRRRTMTTGVKRPTDAEIIIILVQIIKRPDLSVDELRKQLKKHGVRVTEQAVLNLLGDHGIVLKKTPRSRS